MASETVAEKEVALRPGCVCLNAEHALEVRRMLLVGLDCYGEIIKKREEAERAEHLGAPWPREHVPLLATGEPGWAIGQFVHALILTEPPEL